MAICEICNQDMIKVTSCNGNAIHFPDGSVEVPIRNFEENPCHD